MTYEDAVAQHRWDVPRALQHRRRRLRQASARQARDGVRALRRPSRGRLLGRAAGSRAQAAHALAAAGVGRGDRVAVVLPPSPETAAIFFGTWKLGALLLSMSVLYGDDGIRHRLNDSGARVLVTNAANAARFAGMHENVLVLDDGAARRPPDRARDPRHGRRRPRPALLHVGHDRPGEGHRARAPLPARARRVRLLPRRAGRRALPRHGRVGVGGGHRAAARAVAHGRGAVRLPARGRLRPAQAARLPQPPRGRQRLHDADCDALDDGDRRRRHALPAALPHRLQRRRAAQPRGDPLVPRAVRRDGARLLRDDRVLPDGRELPVHGGARGLDGQAVPGLGDGGPRRGRAAGRRPASAASCACAHGRTRTTRSATGIAPRTPSASSAASGSTPATPPRATRTATSGTRAAPTT